MALNWIKRNCQNFNGDPENITLFGHSSGGAATHYLMQTEQCKGLFQKAILMAGIGIRYDKVPNLPHRLANEIGYTGPNSDHAVLEFLSKIDANKLVNFNFWTQKEKDQGFGYTFLPRKEPYESEDTFFTSEPLEALHTSWSNELPIMLGGTSLEDLIMYKRWMSPQVYETFHQHPEYKLPLDLQYACDLSLQRELAKTIKEIHFGKKEYCVENAYCGIEVSLK